MRAVAMGIGGWLLPLTVLAGAPEDDFAERCAAPGVLRCVGFDGADEIAGAWGDNAGVTEGAANPEIDAGTRASGDGALMFTIPSNSAANTSGSYWINFSDDLTLQFGGDEEFFVQWRQRMTSEFAGADYAGGGGPKHIIIGTGDQPGQTFSSCSSLEVVVQNTFQRGFAQMYNSCAGSTSHGAYDGFEEPFGEFDFKLQSERPEPFCLYSQGQTDPSTFLPPAGNCLAYEADTWMTYQVGITTGPRVGDEFVDSRVRLWIGREGEASELVLDWGPYNLTAGPPDDEERFGKVWLLPYNTGKDEAEAHPVAYTWYDELIVSTERIADPGAGPIDPGTGSDDGEGDEGPDDAPGDGPDPDGAAEDTASPDSGDDAPDVGSTDGGRNTDGPGPEVTQDGAEAGCGCRASRGGDTALIGIMLASVMLMRRRDSAPTR